MKKIYFIIVAVVVTMTPTAVNAQQLNSGYFLDGYLYRHDINPAFANEQGYVTMPGIGNLNVSLNSTLPVDKVLYNIDKNNPLRKSHENPAVKELYDTYLEKPGSHRAHELLHTKYEKRELYK